MLKIPIKKVIWCTVITISIFSCTKDSGKINFDESYDVKSSFIIDYKVKMYKDGETSVEIQELNYFDPIVVLSNDVNGKGRIKIKLMNDADGWVEEKYTSFIPNDWQKLSFINDYYCYIPPGLIMELDKEVSTDVSVFRYSDKNYYVSMGLISLFNYNQNFQSKQKTIISEIKRGSSKELNWNKEFNYGNYKVNYVITTEHHDGDISESFDFVKLGEMSLKKYYYVNVDYSPDESVEKKLLQRKILFSALQSLR
jgi:hypothetical protein